MTLPKSKSQQVLEAVPAEHRAVVGLHSNLILNTTPGIRPSDAARRAVADFERLGIDGLRKQHDADHDAALAACGCTACARDLARRVDA